MGRAKDSDTYGILDVRVVDVPAWVTQDFSTFLVRCLLSFSREKNSALSFSLVDRHVEFCVLTN